ncbi:MAG TPA: cytochrome c-type biogenesis protein [Steroidobacteraceae bacterium]|nr:cytochrome c-type biogenesis protein [Steroidobacteraceae bacterium]
MRRARLLRLSGVLAALAALALARGALAVDPTQMPTPELEQRYLALTHELRCMQCQNETLADSPVELAADLRHEIRDMLLAGKSDAEVRAFMVARYGDFILFRPRFTARTAWLWLAPGVLLLIGALVLVRVLRQRAALLPGDLTPVDEDAPN